jgi:hypothetical protein
MDRSFDAGSLNFGWYILRLCAMADVLWDVAGVDLYRGLYDLLHPAQGDRGEEPWTTDEIAGLSPALVDLSAAWPTFG